MTGTLNAKRAISTFDPELRLEIVQLGLLRGYSLLETTEAMVLVKLTVDKRARQFKNEHNVMVDHAKALMGEQVIIKNLNIRSGVLREMKYLKRLPLLRY